MKIIKTMMMMMMMMIMMMMMMMRIMMMVVVVVTIMMMMVVMVMMVVVVVAVVVVVVVYDADKKTKISIRFGACKMRRLNRALHRSITMSHLKSSTAVKINTFLSIF